MLGIRSSGGRARTVALAALLADGCQSSGGDALPCGVAPVASVTRAALPEPAVAPCDAQGWCWENPLPFRDSLGPIWHRPDQTLLTSSRGHVLRLRGETWEALPALPRPAGYTGIPSVHGVWAAGDIIYVAGSLGSRGVVWRYDGSAWTAHTFTDSFRPFHVWGTRPDEIMAVGIGGARLLRGGTWTETNPPRSYGQGLWACGDSFYDAMFAGGFIDEEAVIGRYRGSWERSGVLPAVNVQFSGLSGSANDDIFAGGIVNGLGAEIAWHFDGRTWTEIDIADCIGLLDIDALGGGEALAVGTGTDGIGRVYRFDGVDWSVDAMEGLQELSVATRDDVLGRNNLNVRQFDGASWFSPFTLPVSTSLPAESFVAIFDDGVGTAMALSADGSVYRRTGSAWTPMTPPATGGKTPRAIWGVNANDVHVVGDLGLVWHWDGSNWSSPTLPTLVANTSLKAIFGFAANSVFAVGDSGTVLRYDGSAWVIEDQGVADLVGIWGTSPTDLWAVGDRGELVRYTGSIWDDSTSLPGNPNVVTGIWGASTNRVFVIGDTEVWAYDGVSWAAPTTPPAAQSLTAIWGRSATEVYVVGLGGTAFRFDGSTWIDIHAEHPWSYRAIAGDGTTVRAVGDLGTITVR